MSVRASVLALCFGLAAPSALATSVTVPIHHMAAKSANAFGADLLRRLGGPGENAFFSPLSVATTLAMAWGGASGETAAQMARVLHYTGPQDQHHAWNARLLGDVTQRPGADAVMVVANRLWAAKGLARHQPFATLMKDRYGAGVGQVDFAAGGREVINGWVSQQTRKKIPELLKASDVDAATQLVLTNAIYFKGTWKHGFDPDESFQGAFETAPGKDVQVPFMRLDEKLMVGTGEGWRVVELPYKGDELAMTVFLPETRHGLAGAQAKLTEREISILHGRLHSAKVALTLPKFKLATRYELKPKLSELGMPAAFGVGAQFDGVSPDTKLMISRVVHQAVIEVDETGTVAAAATAVVMTKSASRSVRFAVNEPFIVMIRHRATGAVLFMGRVTNPNG